MAQRTKVKSRKRPSLREENRRLKARLERQKRKVAKLEVEKQDLLAQIRVDFLTKLHNRLGFEERLKEEMARAKRHNTPLTVCYSDIDHFKAVNDTYGHSTGDRILMQFASLLMDKLRDGDVAARLSGDEFALILPQTSLEQADVLFDRLEKAVEEHLKVPVGEQEVARSLVSFGYVEWDKIDDQEALFKKADLRMYQVKSERKLKARRR